VKLASKKERSPMKKKLVKPLRLTPYAWAKLLRLRDLGPTEVGGFGISAQDDLLLVEDIQLVGQTCTAMSVQFHDSSVADYFDRQVDQGLAPERFARLWIHTHPGDCPHPSSTEKRRSPAALVRQIGPSCSSWRKMARPMPDCGFARVPAGKSNCQSRSTLSVRFLHRHLRLGTLSTSKRFIPKHRGPYGHERDRSPITTIPGQDTTHG
jgi:hypothetical protein